MAKGKHHRKAKRKNHLGTAYLDHLKWKIEQAIKNNDEESKEKYLEEYDKTVQQFFGNFS